MRTAQNTSVTSDKIAQTQRTQIYHTSDFYRRRRDEQRKGSDAAAARSGGELYCRQVSNLLLESKLLCTFESRGKARAATVRSSGSEEQRRRGAAAARSSGGEEQRRRGVAAGEELSEGVQWQLDGSSFDVAERLPRRRCCSSPLLLLAAAAAPRRCRCSSPLLLLGAAADGASISGACRHLFDNEKIARPSPFTVQAPRFKDPNVHPPFLLLTRYRPPATPPPLARVNLVF